MGNYTSKIFSNPGEIDSKTKLQTHNGSGTSEKYQCTPITTRKFSPSDPRSATIGIARTPIVIDSTPTGVSHRTVSAIPKYLQSKPYLETDIDSVMAALTPVHHIPDPRSPNITGERTPIIVKCGSEHTSHPVKKYEDKEIDTQEYSTTDLDPRSPAINFDRTPIMKPKSPGNINKMSHDQVAKCDAESTNLKISYCESTIDYNIPEVQALSEIVAYKPINFEKRLETCLNDTLDDDNLEYETNADISSNESDSEGQITIIPNMKVLTHQLQSSNIKDITSDELTNELVDVNKCNSINIVSKPIDSDENQDDNGKIRVWRDSISPTTSAESKAEVFRTREEIIIEFDDEQSVVKPYNKLSNVAGMTDENKINNDFYTGKKKKTQQLIRDIKLIYEDVKECNGQIAIDTYKNRTPLGNRSNNHKPGIITKSPQQLLRSKSLSTKSQQQENTPPRTKRGKSKNKLNATQWDLDRTVVI